MCINFSFASKASFRAVKSQNCERQGVSKFVWKDGLQLQFFSQKADPTVYFLAHLVRLSLYSLIFWPPGGKILTSGEALEEVHALTEQIIEPGIRLTVEGSTINGAEPYAWHQAHCRRYTINGTDPWAWHQAHCRRYTVNVTDPWAWHECRRYTINGTDPWAWH